MDLMSYRLNDFPLYTGTRNQPKPWEVDKNTGELLFPYIPDDELIHVVNLAIQLGRPLLLKGEPGCGKTRLARAVARELNIPFFAWYIKSTTRAQDGLYEFDTVGRLRDAQLVSSLVIGQKENHLKRVYLNRKYINLGPLGEALNFGYSQKRKSVLLIDEIDKADIDFPNDLLRELDQNSFEIKELKNEVKNFKPIAPSKENRPVVFITSNDEKDLPDAFLRRCLFHYIHFPDSDRLKVIINTFFEEDLKHDTRLNELVNNAISRFEKIREMQKNVGGASKKVSTSELIDWFQVLSRHPRRNDVIERLADDNQEVPYLSILLKSWDDQRRYKQMIQLNSKNEI